MQVLGFFGKYETTGRGDLHIHMCIIQPDLQPSQMLEHDHSNPAQLATFVESIMCRVTEGIVETLVIDRNAEPKPMAYFPKTGGPPVQGGLTKEQLHAHLSDSQSDCQIHRHTSTCAKNNGAADDFGCRVSLPRPTVHNTGLLAEGGCLVVKAIYHGVHHTLNHGYWHIP